MPVGESSESALLLCGEGPSNLHVRASGTFSYRWAVSLWWFVERLV